MGSGVRDTFRDALRYAVASIGRIAEEAHYARATFDAYVNSRREPTRAAALALAKALDKRADELIRWARRLRKAARESSARRRAE